MNASAHDARLTEAGGYLKAILENQARTNDKIASIEYCVERILIQLNIKANAKPASATKDHHTVAEMRSVFCRIAVRMAAEYGYEHDINIVLIREEFRKAVTLRPGDLAANGTDEPRWKQHINNALAATGWDDDKPAFVRGERRGYYRVARIGQLALAIVR